MNSETLLARFDKLGVWSRGEPKPLPVVDIDLRIQRLKQGWTDAKAEAASLFQTVCDEILAQCRGYHAICRTPDGEQVAQAEAALLRQKLIEEWEARLTEIWNDIRPRVNALFEELKCA